MALTLKGLPGLEDAEDDSSNIFDTPVVDVSEASENSDAGGDNIFDTPAITQTPVSTEEEMSDATTAVPAQSQNIFAGEGETNVGPVIKSVMETGGTETTVSAGDTTGQVTNIGEYRPPDSTQIGADGGRPTMLPTMTVSETRVGGGTIFDPNALGGPKGPSIADIATATQQATRPGAAGSGASQIALMPTNQGVVPKITRENSPQIFGRLDAPDRAYEILNEVIAEKQAGGNVIDVYDPKTVSALMNEANRRLGTDILYRELDKEAEEREAAKQRQQAGTGIPVVLPLPVSPGAAAAITLGGLILSKGNVATIDPTDPLGSITDIGKGIVDAGKNIFMGPTAPGAPAPGTGTVASTGGLNVGTATPEEIEAAKAEAEARSQQAREEEDARREEENKKQQAAIVLAAQQKKDAEEAKRKAEEDARKAVDEANAQARANIPIIFDLPLADEGPREALPTNTNVPTSTTGDTNVDTCPSPETPILLSDFSTIPAGKLKLGMKVRARLENEDKWGAYEVTQVRIVQSARLRFVFDFGQFVCSPSHKFCEGKFNWIEASSYKAGDSIQDHRILSVEPASDGEVVAITVDQAHTYVSGPFLSHNKSPIPVFVGSGGQTGTATPTEVTKKTSCPSPETPILLPDLKTIPAGELKVGMNVMARLENQLIWGGYPVTRVEIVKDQRLKFTFDYGTFICSPTHKFCHNDWQWREASSYSVGDEIQDHKILAIEPDGEGDVVVITVDEAHTYVAGPFLSHNKTTAPIVTTVTPNNTTTPTTATTPGGVNITVTGDQTPLKYTAPAYKEPAQRSTFEEASKQIGALKAKTGRQLLGYEMGPDNKLVPVYSSPTGETTVAEDVVSGYGKTARGMTQEDLQNLFASIEAQTGISRDKLKGEGGYQGALTKAAADQTEAANRALRRGNLADAAEFGMQARRLREMANPELYGETGALPQFTRAAQGQVTRDIDALRAAERGELSREAIRNAQQATREAFGARGRLRDTGAMAQEILNREAAVQQRQQLARQNLAQSMGQLGQGIGYQTSNVFDPMAAALGQQYGMQTSNVGLNQALYNQAMGMASGQGGYGFAQQLYNPFSNYAADVYGTNVNAINAAQIAEANRLASLEAARMGEAAARNAANTQMAMGGVDFLYKLGLGKGWWG